ncbi:hypothetical protein [Desulfosoma sp.]
MMSTKKTNAALDHCTGILKFWHKVELTKVIQNVVHEALTPDEQ